jgi:hypothetical protein
MLLSVVLCYTGQQVQHVVLCENKNMTVSGVAPYTFARGSKHVSADSFVLIALPLHITA